MPEGSRPHSRVTKPTTINEKIVTANPDGDGGVKDYINLGRLKGT